MKMEEYKNKQSQEIEDFLNNARDLLNSECPNLMPYKADVRFLKPKE